MGINLCVAEPNPVCAHKFSSTDLQMDGHWYVFLGFIGWNWSKDSWKIKPYIYKS